MSSPNHDQNHRLPTPAARLGLSRDVGLAMVLQALAMTEGPVQIGRFEVRARLGQGAMGTVYRAWDPLLQREVALKVIDTAVRADVAEAVRQEARALARLAHPNVVAVHELGIEAGQIFVAMEYVPGLTMREVADSDDPPDAAEIVALFAQAGRGLEAAHNAGLVHRDIKPENILVAEDGRVRVADFGLATMADGAEAEVAGTLQFMAPEVLAHGHASVYSDQFAFCASLWRLLDPEAPLGAETARMDPRVHAALTRGLQRQPASRWPSMGELLHALVPPATILGSRQRELLLRRVHRLWIDGVLRPALAEGPLLDVPLTPAPDAVDAPFEASIPRAAGLRTMLEAGQGSLLILGEPGAGKTTAMLQLADSLLHDAKLDPSAPVPVVLALASLGAFRGRALDWVEDELVAKYGLPRPSVRQWIESGALVLLLDGLDEVGTARRARVAEALNTLRAEAGLSLVVTCRTSVYPLLPPLRFGFAVSIDPLPPEVVRAHVRVPGAAASLGPHLRTPLSLRLLEGLDDELPEDGPLQWLYGRFVDHALQNTPAEEQERLMQTLTFLAAAMSRGDRTELWLEELSPGWLFSDGRRYAAHALAVLLLATVCIGLNALAGHFIDGDLFSGVMLGLVSLVAVLALSGGMRIQRVERIKFSPGRIARIAPLSAGIGFVAGAIYGSFYLLWVNIVFGTVAGLVGAVVIAFEPSPRETNLHPNVGMRQSAMNGMTIGLGGFLLGAITLGYITVPLVLPHLEPPSTLIGLPHPERSAAAVAGLLVGVIAGMVQGGWSVLQHIATRLMLAITTPVPLRLVPLLDLAVERALMRRIGGGYLFPHRTLQLWLADREP